METCSRTRENMSKFVLILGGRLVLGGCREPRCARWQQNIF